MLDCGFAWIEGVDRPLLSGWAKVSGFNAAESILMILTLRAAKTELFFGTIFSIANDYRWGDR
ncbi:MULTISPECIES: hypothetical protein [unclassified Microcoleus]|uniref:hypothetical protein n=1 Tax=unclassified Microcoleus TaxID=2642155 RepID=UPI002FD52B59